MPRRDNKPAKADWTTGYRIPETIEVNDFVEFCFRLPANADYQNVFWEHLEKLGTWVSWEHYIKRGAKDYRAKEVAEYFFREVWLINKSRFDEGFGCGGEECDECEESQCIEYLPSDPAIKWLPTNPYDGKHAVSPGYLTNPFRVSTGDEWTGIEGGIVYSSIDEFLYGINPINQALQFAKRLLNGGLPRFEFTFVGKGEVELHFTDFPQGGMFMVRDKANILATQFIETSSISGDQFDEWIDALITLIGLGVSGGIFPDHIIELNFENDEEHEIEVTWLPKITFPDVLGMGYGGGLKKIVVCGGNLKAAPPKPPVIRPGEGGIEYQDPVTHEWILIENTYYIIEASLGCEDNECEDCDESEEC